MSSWEARVKMRGTPLSSLNLVPRERHEEFRKQSRNQACEQLLSCWSVPKNQRKRLQFPRDSRLGRNTVINWKCAMVWETHTLMSKTDSLTTCAGWASNLTSLNLSFLVLLNENNNRFFSILQSHIVNIHK